MGRSAAFALHPSQKSAEDTGCELVSDCSCTKSVVTAQSGILGAGRAAVVVAVRARRATRIEAECAALARAGVVGGRTGGRGGAKRQVECRRPCWVEKEITRADLEPRVPQTFGRQYHSPAWPRIDCNSRSNLSAPA